MLKANSIEVIEKKKKDGSGTYKVLQITFPNGFIWQSNLNKGYLKPETEFILMQNDSR